MDPEIEAISQISKALEHLDHDAVRRVLKWAIERYQPRTSSVGPSIDVPSISTEPSRSPSRTFLDLPELFDAAAAETGLDKVMVVAYWHQVIKEREDWDSLSINNDLKHLGHPSSNITRDLDSLMNRAPKLVMQTRKQGTTQQARKLYKLTREGIRAVDSMLAKTAPFAQGS
jgi:hypothetical protein